MAAKCCAGGGINAGGGTALAAKLPVAAQLAAKLAAKLPVAAQSGGKVAAKCCAGGGINAGGGKAGGSNAGGGTAAKWRQSEPKP